MSPHCCIFTFYLIFFFFLLSSPASYILASSTTHCEVMHMFDYADIGTHTWCICSSVRDPTGGRSESRLGPKDSQCTQVGQLHPWNIWGHCAFHAKFCSRVQPALLNWKVVSCHAEAGTSYQLRLFCKAPITAASELKADPRPTSTRSTALADAANRRTFASSRYPHPPPPTIGIWV